jgi:hypothetical protein
MRALTLTFAGALLLSTSALADTTWITRADLNGDGVVTPAEAQRHEYLVMVELDDNRDGVITKSEWDYRPDFTFEYADFNNDNVLTAQEIHNGYVSGFRYNGVKTVPSYPLPSVVTTTTTYPVARVYTYNYYPYSYTGALSPPVAAVPVAPVIVEPTVPVIVEPKLYVPPEQGYILRGPVQQPVYAPEPNYSYNPQPSDGVTVMSDSQLAYGDLAPGNPFALDVNRDGVLTISEVLRYNDWNFQRHDKNANGWLEDYEWDLKAQEHFGHRVNPAVLGTLTHDTFNRHDRDNDGRVSKTEWDRQIEAEFATLDGNNDGQLHHSDFQMASN